MEKVLFTHPETFLSALVSQVRASSSQSFHMAYAPTSDITHHYLFVQIPIGTEGCSYVFGRTGESEEVYTCLKQALQVLAIVTPKSIYLNSELVNFGLSIWTPDEWRAFNDSVDVQCVYFPNWCQEYRQRFFATEIKPYYDALTDLPELDNEQMFDCLSDARKYIVFQTRSDILEDYSPAFGISNSAIAQQLCGVTKPIDDYRKLQLTGEQTRMKLHKALQNYTLSLIRDNAGFAPWELDLIHSLQGLSLRSHLDVTFRIDGKTGLGIMTPMAILTAMSDRGNFYSRCFYSHHEGKKLIMKLTGSTRYLTPKDIIKIEAKSAVIYERNCTE